MIRYNDYCVADPDSLETPAMLLFQDVLDHNIASVCEVVGGSQNLVVHVKTHKSEAVARKQGATVFGYRVSDPERYGVVEFDDQKRVVSIEEKPLEPRSNFAVTGLYFYDNHVLDIAANLKPSARGELEITDVNREYLGRDALHVAMLGRGIAWLDTGTPHSLLNASNYIQAIEERQGLMVACLEEVACEMGFIGAEQVAAAAKRLAKTEYGQYLSDLVDEMG